MTSRPEVVAGVGLEVVSQDMGLQCLALLLRFHQVAVDPAQIAHKNAGSVVGIQEMLRCAKQLKLKAQAVRESGSDLTNADQGVESSVVIHIIMGSLR